MGGTISVAETPVIPTPIGQGGKKLGQVVVTVWDDKPVEYEWSGEIRGRELSLILHSLEKGYNRWKKGLMKAGK